MGDTFSSKDIKNWLEKPENKKRLTREATKIYRKVKQRKIPLMLIDRETVINEPPQEAIAIIESELVILLYEKRSNFKKLLDSDDKKFSSYLVKSYYNQIKDITRKKDVDPRKYLYKRLADNLRVSEKFHTDTDEKKGFSIFSCEKKNQRIAPLTLEDISEISFPTHLVEDLEYKYINQKKIFFELSEYFWNQISQMHGGKAIWVDVWSVIEWIGSHVRMDVSDQTEGIELPVPPRASYGDNEKIVHDTTLERIADPHIQAVEAYYDRDLIEKWADCFAGRLNQKEKAVFYLRYAHELGFKEIARKLKYKSSSGPHRPLEQAKDKLRFFLRDLDWLNPEDLNEEAFALFRDNLLSILKKSVSES